MSPHVCPPWLSFILDNRLRRAFQDPDRILGRFLRPGDRVADIGCGPGFFSIPMARRVGETGRIVSVDIDKRMLEMVRRRAVEAGLDGRIELRAARRDQLGLGAREFDFALAFWMAHEVRVIGPFLNEIRQSLKPNGSFLLAEPRLHVSPTEFERIVAAAQAAGWRKCDPVRIRWSRAVVFGPDREVMS